MLSKQEIFTKVKTHLLQQNQRAKEDGGCRYRTSTGLKCAVGCLIPDELYDRSIEGVSVSLNPYSPLGNALLKSGIPGDDTEIEEMLYDLQKIHDRVTPLYWSTALQDLARKYNVN